MTDLHGEDYSCCVTHFKLRSNVWCARSAYDGKHLTLIGPSLPVWHGCMKPVTTLSIPPIQRCSINIIYDKAQSPNRIRINAIKMNIQYINIGATQAFGLLNEQFVKSFLWNCNSSKFDKLAWRLQWGQLTTLRSPCVMFMLPAPIYAIHLPFNMIAHKRL